MAVQEPVVEEPEDDEDEDSSEEGGLLWVPKALIEEISEALEKKTAVTKEKVPCDMSDAAEVEDVVNIVDTLGPEKVAEMFVNGRKKFLEGLQSLPAEAKENIKQEMSGQEYKAMMEAEAAMLMEGEESDMEEDDEEEEDDDEAVPEPASKKAKSA